MVVLKNLYFSIIIKMCLSIILNNELAEIKDIVSRKTYSQQCSKFKNFTIKEFTSFGIIEEIIENNVKNIVNNSGLTNYLDLETYFKKKKNLNALFEGLEFFIQSNYFSPLYKYACIMILFEENRLEKLDQILSTDIKKLYRDHIGPSSHTTLLLKSDQLYDSSNLAHNKIFHQLLRSKIDHYYREFVYEYKNFDLIFTSFSFIIYDQIDRYFENSHDIRGLTFITSSIRLYIDDLLSGRPKKYSIVHKNHISKFINAMDNYFDKKLQSSIKEQGNYINFRILIGTFEECLELKTGLQELFKVNKNNIILEKILEALSSINESTMQSFFFEINVRRHIVINFFELCKYNKKTEKISEYLEIFDIEILYIREFYRSIGIDRLSSFGCLEESAITLIMPLIFKYRKGKSKIIDNITSDKFLSKRRRAMQANPEKFSTFITRDKIEFKDFCVNIEILDALNGYYNLISRKLGYKIIEESISDTNSCYALDELIESIVIQVFSEKEKDCIYVQRLHSFLDLSYSHLEKRESNNSIAKNRNTRMVLAPDQNLKIYGKDNVIKIDKRIVEKYNQHINKCARIVCSCE